MTAVAEAVASQLAAAGVRRGYTVPGESFLPLLDAFDRHPDLRLISTRHESGAAFMAEADAKLTGVPAVAMATRAVGAANLAIGVHTAYQDSTPMIVLLGQVETSYLGREAFQEVDLPAFYGQITKWSATAPTKARIPELVARALQVAVSGRPGPVMIALPSDLLEGDLDGDDRWWPGSGSRPSPPISGALATTVARALLDAELPVVIAGGGAQRARRELIALAEAFGAGVYASFRRQDVFPNDHPNYLGHLTIGTAPETLEALSSADLVVVLGARLSEVTTQRYRLPRPDQKTIQIDVEPVMVGSVLPVSIGIVADVAAALSAILDERPSAPPGARWERYHQSYLATSNPLTDHQTANHQAQGLEPLHPAGVMAAINEVFSPATIVTNDAGNFSAFAHRYRRFTEPGTQLGPTSGAMGYGVPAAVAAKLAAPDRQVLALAGDGGFLMTGQELEVAVRHGLPLTIVVFRNGLYGTIALHQARMLGRIAGVDIGAVDIAAVARGYGASAWTATSPHQLVPALIEARDCGGPAVVDVIVDPDVLTPGVRLSTLLDSFGT